MTNNQAIKVLQTAQNLKAMSQWVFYLNFPLMQNRPQSFNLTSYLWLHTHTFFTLTFTFMHLADAFIQSDLQCIQAIHFYQYFCSLEIEPPNFFDTLRLPQLASSVCGKSLFS